MSEGHPVSGKAPKSKIILPALPRMNTTQVSNRSQMTSSPMRPSPLRESTISGIANLSIITTPSATPPDNEMPKTGGNLAAPASLTPPDSSGPVIVDGSRVTKNSQAATANNAPSLHLGEVLESTKWSTSDGEFVQSALTQSPDDPFLTTPAKPTKTAKSVGATPIVQSVGRSLNTAETAFSPRIDRLGEPISARNAQGVLSPHALSNQRTDDQLEFSVEHVFATFGKCHVKIRRDKNKMPFAFAQFENVEDARLAICEARGIEIDGRPIRTEKANVPRAAYLCRITGGPISDDEARAVLEMYGAVEATCPVPLNDQQLAGLPDGIWVQFAFFQDYRDALSAFRHHDHYRLIVIPKDDEAPRRIRSNVSPSPRRNPRRGQVADAKSIFVGNLPPGTTETQLAEIFSQYGRVISVTVNPKRLLDNRTNVFAFIGFQTAREAQNAIGADINIGGWPARIEQKRHTYNGNGRTGFSPQSAQGHHDQILSCLYRQGLEMGLPHESAARILNAGRRFGQGIYGNISSTTNLGNSTPMTSYGNMPTMAGYSNTSQIVGYGNGSPMAGYGNGTPPGNYANGTPVAGYANTTPYENYGNAAPIANYGNPSSMPSYVAAQYSNLAYNSPMSAPRPVEIPSPTPMGPTLYAAPSLNADASSNQYSFAGRPSLNNSLSNIPEVNDRISEQQEQQTEASKPNSAPN